jgi:hypothetical protein
VASRIVYFAGCLQAAVTASFLSPVSNRRDDQTRYSLHDRPWWMAYRPARARLYTAAPQFGGRIGPNELKLESVAAYRERNLEYG